MLLRVQSLNVWQWLFVVLWCVVLTTALSWNHGKNNISRLHRYVRLIVNTISHWVYKSVPIPLTPSYLPRDVTVVIPTIHNNFAELHDNILSILHCRPYELMIVTTADKYKKLVAFTETIEATNIRCYSVPIANKRLQLCEAIPRVKTAITVLADDDVTWPITILPYLLAPFENQNIGAVGSCQQVKRIRSGSHITRTFDWLGAVYIERRNFEISATHGVDGGTSCMSGRTCAFRSCILSSVSFMDGFKTEKWGKYRLNADDDNFITRWLVANGWRTWIQYRRECEIETTLENDWKFLLQCSRWARSNWRSNWTSLVRERFVWRRQPYSTYAIHIATFTSLSCVFDPLILYLFYKATSPQPATLTLARFSPLLQPPITTSYESSANNSSLTFTPRATLTLLIFQLLFMLFSKTIKLLPLFLRNPTDLLFIPASICFGYLHGLIKIYALLTLRVTSWGSRIDGDTDDSHRMTPVRSRRSESLSFDGFPSSKDQTGTSSAAIHPSGKRRKSEPAACFLQAAGKNTKGKAELKINGPRGSGASDWCEKSQEMWKGRETRHEILKG